MQNAYKALRDAVKKCPLPLAMFPAKLQKIAEEMMPYQVGIEVECGLNNLTVELAEKIFQEIEDIISVNFDDTELRFRIPSGIKGMNCLYKITEYLKKYALLNPDSGIHYHIDCTDVPYFQYEHMYYSCKGENSWVLDALKSWNYTGQFNKWSVSDVKTAVKFHKHYKTVEFRIGEMTFDYELMMKRILHCQNIVRKLKG